MYLLYNTTGTGAGHTVYVIDTGVYASSDFGGRAEQKANFALGDNVSLSRINVTQYDMPL